MPVPSGCAVMLWSIPVGIGLVIIGFIASVIGSISLPSLPSFSKKEEAEAAHRALQGTRDGHRICGGRRYGMRLELKPNPAGELWVNGTVPLFEGRDTEGAVTGPFFIGGEHSGEKPTLEPEFWKGGSAPSGQAAFTLRADVPYGTPTALSGKLKETEAGGLGCTAFEVAKRKAK